MRDVDEDGTERDGRVTRAYSEIETQRLIIASMHDDDPALPMAHRVLERMRRTAAISEPPRAMTLDEAEGDVR